MALYVKYNLDDTFEWLPNGEIDFDGLSEEELQLQDVYIAKSVGFAPYGKYIHGYGFKWNDDKSSVIFDPVYADVNIDEIRYEKKMVLAQRRWERETGGISVNGISISTDDRSQTKLLAMLFAVQLDPNYTVEFKSATGDFVTLNAQTIFAVAMAVRNYIQACFDKEQEFINQINTAITVEEVAAIDIENNWPSQVI